MRIELLSPKTSVCSLGRSFSCRTPARKASSMSWLIYAILSAYFTTTPSKVDAIFEPVWFTMPSRTSNVRFIPFPSCSTTSTTRRLCSKCLNPVGLKLSSALSPEWPNGVCPKSCPIAIASTRSSFKRRARAMVLAICETSSVWVSRVRKWSLSHEMKTCVLCFNLRKDFECIILSRSRAKSVRRLHFSSKCARPRLSAEQTARGERICLSSFSRPSLIHAKQNPPR